MRKCTWPILGTRMIENVQIRAIKLVDGLKSLPYEDRLRMLNLPTWNSEEAVVIWLKYATIHIHRYERNVLSSNFHQQPRPSRKRNFHLVENRPADRVRGKQFNSFYSRNNRRWNDLPTKVVDVSNVNVFKNRLDKEWGALSSKESEQERIV